MPKHKRQKAKSSNMLERQPNKLNKAVIKMEKQCFYILENPLELFVYVSVMPRLSHIFIRSKVWLKGLLILRYNCQRAKFRLIENSGETFILL